MKICLLTAYFPPDQGSASNLFYILGAEFVRRGHEVTVLTGFPSYNVDERALTSDPSRGDKLTEHVAGMRVLRTRSARLPRGVPVLRGLSQLSMMWSFALRGILKDEVSADVVLVYSPPLFLGLTAFVLRRFRGARVIVNVQDLFPQSAIDLGLMRNRALIRMFRSIESWIYRSADRIAVHSEGNRQHVLQCGGGADRTLVVPNLVDTGSIIPGPRMGKFRQRYGIDENVCVISFAGVIGLSQDLDTVLDAAIRTAHAERIVYYIVGDGLEKPRLERRAASMNNVRFLPMLPQDEYRDLLQGSDVCLATLRHEVKTPVVPSKILSIMSAGRPVLASMPMSGDAPALVKTAGAGVCVPPEDGAAMAEAILSLYDDPAGRTEMGRAGRVYVERECTLGRVASLYEEIFHACLHTPSTVRTDHE